MDEETMRKARYILACLCCVFGLGATAQVQVEQQIDSMMVLIGEQVHLTVDVTAPAKANIQFPELKPSTYFVPGVELLAVSGDTVDMGEGTRKVSRILTLTSFDENLYSLPPVKVKVDGREYKGNQLALKVITLDVDTLHPNQFFPPKDVQNNPFQWSDWSALFWLSVLLVLLALLSYWLLQRLKENKPIITRIRIVKKVLPHQKALTAIDEIKAEHMQTSENQKDYYTRLTDTLRQYIEERFGFSAMQMTSSEIIYKLRESGDQTMIDELKELFTTADLVKFAKYSALLDENDMNLVNAIHFIDQTKLEGQPTEERIVPKLTDDDKRSRKNRIAIKTVLWILAVLMTALLAYIIYNMWTLM